MRLTVEKKFYFLKIVKMNLKLLCCLLFVAILGYVQSLSVTQISVVEGKGEQEDDPIREGKKEKKSLFLCFFKMAAAAKFE